MSLRTLLQKDKNTGVYYFRQRVPSDLLELIGKKELKQSLRTKDPKQAKRLATLAELETHRQFDNLRHPNGLPEDHQSDIRVLKSTPIVPPTLSIVTSASSAPLLTAIYERWKNERRPSLSSIREWDLAVRRFVELNGDLAVDKITKEHIRNFKDTLLSLPLRAASVAARGETDDKRTLSSSTVNKILSAIKSQQSLIPSPDLMAWKVHTSFL